MKTLILLRHAKSAWDDPGRSDFDRPLNARGRRAARTVGRELRARGFDFDAVLASPAARVVETLADVGQGFGRTFRPVYDERLYLASPTTLLDFVRSADEGVDRLLLVGHNPGLERLALLLTREDGNGLRAKMAEKFPTGTLAEIRLDAGSWRDVAAGSGRLARFIRPRDIKAELGAD